MTPDQRRALPLDTFYVFDAYMRKAQEQQSRS